MEQNSCCEAEIDIEVSKLRRLNLQGTRLGISGAAYVTGPDYPDGLESDLSTTASTGAKKLKPCLQP